MPTELTVPTGRWHQPAWPGGLAEPVCRPGHTRKSSLPRCPLRDALCGAGSTSAAAPGSPQVRAIQELWGGLRSGPAAVLIHSAHLPNVTWEPGAPSMGQVTCTILPKPVQSVSREFQRAHSLLRTLCLRMHGVGSLWRAQELLLPLDVQKPALHTVQFKNSDLKPSGRVDQSTALRPTSPCLA